MEILVSNCQFSLWVKQPFMQIAAFSFNRGQPKSLQNKHQKRACNFHRNGLYNSYYFMEIDEPSAGLADKGTGGIFL